MFIDESEQLKKKNGKDNIMPLLNSGFQKGARVSRTEQGKAVEYRAYCPKMFAGINDMNDVLQSRTIHIKMLRKLPEEKVDRYTNDAATTAIQNNLRDDLYIFGLQYADNLRETYENGIDSVTKLNDFQNRLHDILTPIFIIASIIEKESNQSSISDSVAAYINSQKELQAEKDLAENTTSRILSKIDEVLNKVPYTKKDETGGSLILKYSTETIYNEFVKDSVWKRELGTKNKLSIELGKISIRSKPENVKGKSQKCYVVDVAELTEFGKRYGVTISFTGKDSSEEKIS